VAILRQAQDDIRLGDILFEPKASKWTQTPGAETFIQAELPCIVFLE
jgi:hypothetical protein